MKNFIEKQFILVCLRARFNENCWTNSLLNILADAIIVSGVRSSSFNQDNLLTDHQTDFWRSSLAALLAAVIENIDKIGAKIWTNYTSLDASFFS